MTRLFLKFELEKIIRYFKTRTLAKAITGSLFLVVFAFVGVGIYFFFISGFRYINVSVEQEIQLPLNLFIYELFLVVMGAVIVFSSIVSGIFVLFRGEYDNWMISSPGYKLFPRLVLVKSILSSSWPLFIMFLPAVLAFNKVYGLGIISLFFILVSVIVLLILLNAITLLVILVVSYLYSKITQTITVIKFNFGGLISLLLLIVLAVASHIWRAVSGIDLVKLFKADNADVVINIANISSHFNLLPTHPFALEIINWQSGMQGAALINFIMLTLLTSVFVVIWWKISFIFYPLWQKFQEGSVRAIKKDGTYAGHTVTYYFTGSPTLALFKKEALVSARNLKGVLWFLFLSSIWLAQIGTNMILSHNIQKYQTDVSEKLAVFQALQFIIAIYFICSFALRFVFPSFSVEKKTAWILASAPLSFRRIFFSKYLFYTLFFVIVGTLMSYINNSILHVPFSYGVYSTLLFVSATIFIVTFGLTLGAVFPSTETDDPEAITTSMPGLFFTAFSLIYGAVCAWMLYITLIKGTVLPVILFAIFTLSFVGITLLFIPRLTRNRSF
jgi:hypothetical protein